MRQLFFLHKAMLGLLSVFLCISVNLCAQYQPGLATIDDIPELNRMYDAMTEDDATKLVIFPREVRSSSLHSAIIKNRIFVMRETGSNRIVSLLKMYLIDDLDELRNILANEIRARADNLYETFPYEIDQEFLERFEEALDLTKKLSRTLSGEPKTPCPLSSTPPTFVMEHAARPKRAAYLYYGAGYTHPAHRNKRLNTELQRHAFSYIREAVMTYITTNRCEELIEVFGQVNSNTRKTNSIRMFALYASQIYEQKYGEKIDPVEIVYCGYHAVKPAFDFLDGKLIQCPDEDPRAQAGIGKILTFSLGHQG